MDRSPGHEISTDFLANHRRKRTKVVFLNPSEVGSCDDTDHHSGEYNFTSREDAKRSELLNRSGTCPSFSSSTHKKVESSEGFDLKPQRQQSTRLHQSSMNRVNVKVDADSKRAAVSAPQKLSARCNELDDRATAEEVQDSSEDDSDTQDSSAEPQAVASVKSKTQLERMCSPESSPLSSLDDDLAGTSDEEEAEDELACLDPDDDEEHIRSMLSMDPVKLRHESPPLRLPASASDLVCPRQHLLDALGIYEVLRRYGQLLRLSPFRLEDMLAALVASENSLLLAEIHMTLLRALLREDDANNTVMYSADCKDSVCLSLQLMDRYTWPYLLAAYLDQVYTTEASAQGAAASLPTLSVAAGTAAGVMGGTTTSGGADIVVSAGVFSPGTLPLHTEYPFVPLAYRVAVLRGLTALFLSTGVVRGEVLRDGFILHEDYCRACDNSGDVLCCDSCPAVFHLNCLVPPLIEVPTTAWYCPVCVENQVSGVTDCLSEAERTGKDHRHDPLGRDRAGRVYWYLGRRLLVERVDFCKREPDLPGLIDGDYDPVWEVNCALTDSAVDEATRPELVEYADEPSLYYYSSLEQVMQVRRQLSRRWEPWLCHQLDGLLPRMTLEMEVTKRLTRVGLERFRLLCPSPGGEVVSVLFSETDTVPKVRDEASKPDSEPVPQPIHKAIKVRLASDVWCRHQLQAGSIVSSSSALTEDGASDSEQCLLKTSRCATKAPITGGELGFIASPATGYLVRNVDNVFTRLPKSAPSTTGEVKPPPPPPTVLTPAELEELSAMLQMPTTSSLEEVTAYRLSDERLWSSWVNLYDSDSAWTVGRSSFSTVYSLMRQPSDGLSSPLVGDEEGEEARGETNGINLALTRSQRMEERERRRWLAAKFTLGVAATGPCSTTADSGSTWVYREPPSTSGEHGVTSGDYMIEVVRATLCHMEAQIPLAFYTPAWRSHRIHWLSELTRSSSTSKLAGLLAQLEAAIRPMCFHRIWFTALGHIAYERSTAAQREEDKRLRQLTNSASGAANAPSGSPLNVIRTHNPRPIRHSVWKFRGEEYRRLGGDGWMWLARERRATRLDEDVTCCRWRRQQSVDTIDRCRLGLGWGVCPEYLAQRQSVTVGGETGAAQQKQRSPGPLELHPITGVPLHRIPTRPPYLLPGSVLTESRRLGKLQRAQAEQEMRRFEAEQLARLTELSDDGPKQEEQAPNDEEEVKVDCKPVTAKSGEKLALTPEEVDPTPKPHDVDVIKAEKEEVPSSAADEEEEQPPVLDVSYGLTARFHYPPERPRTLTTSSGAAPIRSRRAGFHLDQLLLSRRQAAGRTDKSTALTARVAVTRLTRQISSVQAERDSLIGEVERLQAEAKQAMAAVAQLSTSSQTGKPAPPPAGGQLKRIAPLVRGADITRLPPLVLTPQGQGKRLLPIPEGDGGVSSDDRNSHQSSHEVRRSARKQRRTRTDPDFVVDFDDNDDDDANAANVGDGDGDDDGDGGLSGEDNGAHQITNAAARRSGVKVMSSSGEDEAEEEEEDDDDDLTGRTFSRRPPQVMQQMQQKQQQQQQNSPVKARLQLLYSRHLLPQVDGTGDSDDEVTSEQPLTVKHENSSTTGQLTIAPEALKQAMAGLDTTASVGTAPRLVRVVRGANGAMTIVPIMSIPSDCLVVTSTDDENNSVLMPCGNTPLFPANTQRLIVDGSKLKTIIEQSLGDSPVKSDHVTVCDLENMGKPNRPQVRLGNSSAGNLLLSSPCPVQPRQQSSLLASSPLPSSGTTGKSLDTSTNSSAGTEETMVRHHPAILRRTLAVSSLDPAGARQSSSSRSSSIASLIATNTARQIVCGSVNNRNRVSLSSGSRVPASDRVQVSFRSPVGRGSGIQNDLTRIGDKSRLLMSVVDRPMTGQQQYHGGLIRLTTSSLGSGTVTITTTGGSNQRVRLLPPGTTTIAAGGAYPDLAAGRILMEARQRVRVVEQQLAVARAQLKSVEQRLSELESSRTRQQHLSGLDRRSSAEPYSLHRQASGVESGSSPSFSSSSLVPPTLVYFGRRSKRGPSLGWSAPTGSSKASTTKLVDSDLVRLPHRLPPTGGYLWPPLAWPRHVKRLPSACSLFRRSARSIRHLILAGGRREIPGYDVEKKRLVQICWPYPTSKPNFSEAWRFRVAQLQTMPSSPSQGQAIAGLALLLRTLWHSLIWPELLADAQTRMEARDLVAHHEVPNRVCLRELLPGEQGGLSRGALPGGATSSAGGVGPRSVEPAYCARRIVGVQPLDPFWLRMNYLVELAFNRPAVASSGKRNRGGRLSSSTPCRRIRRGRSKQASSTGVTSTSPGDPDYSPWTTNEDRLGIAQQRRRSSRPVKKSRRSLPMAEQFEEGSGDDAPTSDDDGGEGDALCEVGRREVKVEERWFFEDELYFWEIRSFMDVYLPPSLGYPPASDRTSTGSGAPQPGRLIPARLVSKPKPELVIADPEGVTVGFADQYRQADENEHPRAGITSVTGGGDKLMTTSGHVVAASQSVTVTAVAQGDGRTEHTESQHPLITSQSLMHSVGGQPPQQQQQMTGTPTLGPSRARSLAASRAAKASVAARQWRRELAGLEHRAESLRSGLLQERQLYARLALLRAENELAEHQENLAKRRPLPTSGTRSLMRRETPEAMGRVVRTAMGSRVGTNPRRRGRPPLSQLLVSSGQRAVKRVGCQSPDLEATPKDSGSPKPPAEYRAASRSMLMGMPKRRGRPPLHHRLQAGDRESTLLQAKKKGSRQNSGDTPSLSSPAAPSTPSTSPGVAVERAGGVGEEPVPSGVASAGRDKNAISSVERGRTPRGRLSRLSSSSRGGPSRISSVSRRPPVSLASSSSSPPGCPTVLSTPQGRAAASRVLGRPRGGRRGGSDGVRREDDQQRNGIRQQQQQQVRQESKDDDGTLYCVCRTKYDPTKDYIGCDLCHDWFHFACVGLSDNADSSQLGDSWYCPDCRAAKCSAGDMVYCLCRTPYEANRVYIACDQCDEWYHSECVGLTPQEAADHVGTYICPQCTKQHPNTLKSSSSPTPASSRLLDKSPEGKKKKNRKKASSPSSGPNPDSAGEGSQFEEVGAPKTIYQTELAEETREDLIRLLHSMKNHKMSWPFLYPPDRKKYPAAEELKDCKSLLIVLEALKAGVYATLGDFLFAMNQVFTDARVAYLKGTPEYQCIDVMEAFFLCRMKPVKTQLLKSHSS